MNSSVRPAVSLFVLALVLFLLGCSHSSAVSEPLQVTNEIEDVTLRDFIASTYKNAQENHSSGLHRGRLAMAFDANGFHAEALETYRQARSLDPATFRWPYLQAHLEAEIGDIDNALESLHGAIANDSSYSPAFIIQAVWLLDKGLPEDALASLNVANTFELDPSQQQATSVFRAVALLRLNRTQEALNLLEDLEVDYVHPFIARQLQQVRLRLGHDVNVSVSQDVEELKWSDPEAASKLAYVRSYSGMLFMAEEMIESGRSEDAIAVLENLRRTHPDEEAVDNNLSIAYRLNGDKEGAFQILHSALKKHPSSHSLHFNLGVLHEEEGNVGSALESFRKAIDYSRESPTCV